MGLLALYMAPLQGLTEAPFRNSFEKNFGGVDAYFTPFVRQEHGGPRRKDLRGLEPDANAVPRLVPQLMAASADEADLLLRPIAALGYREFDLNLGCAFPAMAKKGKGCGILPHPERVADLLGIAGRHPEYAFSVKMRLGYEDAEECMRLLPVLNAARLSRVTVHARTGKQQYKGECDLAAFARFAAECRHPVVYNGDVRTLEAIGSLQRDFPFLQGVMLGRGLLAAPWLAAEYRQGEEWTTEARLAALRSLHRDVFEAYSQRLEGGEGQLLTTMKGFWDYWYPEGDRKWHKKISKSTKLADYLQAVSCLLEA